MLDLPAPPAFAEEALDVLVESRVPARADRLKLLRGSVRAAARMCGLDDSTAQSVVLAVDEACQNVVVHGYADRKAGEPEGEIVLTLARCAEGLLVRLRDFAPPVDAARIRPRDLADLRPGKLGTHFIREIMDAAAYRPAPQGRGNVLEMVKRKEPRP